MKKLLRKAINLLGEKHRHKIYRKFLTVPPEISNPDFRIEVARTREDLERAYALLHDCYVGINIIDPQPSGLRCNFFSFLPTSTIIVAKLGDRVVGTMSAIKDSSLGLPSDKEFLNENNNLRKQSKILIEASALAVDPEFRGNHCVSFLLMKYIYNYSKNCFGCDFLVCAVHPKAEDFYKAVLQFRKNSEVLKYNGLKDAEAIHISMDLSTEHLDKVIQAFGTDDPSKNVGIMFRLFDQRFHYPRQKPGQMLNPVITPDLLKYFCFEKEEVWTRIGEQDRKRLVQIYSTYFGFESMREFKESQLSINEIQEYRTPIEISSILKTCDQFNFCDILDLTSSGCFIDWQNELLAVGQKVSLAFCFEEKSYKIQGEIAWQNENSSLHHRRGLGIRFINKVPSLTTQLQQWLYGRNSLSVVREANVLQDYFG